MLFDEDNLDFTAVGVYRYVVFRQVVVEDSPQAVIGLRRFVQCHADTPDDTAEDLAACGLGVDDAARCHSADHPGDLDRAQVFIDLHLDEHGAMGRGGEGFALGAGRCFDLHLEKPLGGTGHDVRKCKAVVACL
ncbi:hypothetical protein D3C79_879240 [compost metagenome]